MMLSNSVYGSIFQSNKDKKIELNFLHTTIKMCITDFLLQRGKINRINVENCINDLSDAADNFEFVVSKHSFKLHLTLVQFIWLKDLVNQAMYTLELQSILERANISLAIEQEVVATF